MPTEKAMKKLLNKLGEEELRLLLKVRSADDSAKSEVFKDKFVDIKLLSQVIDKVIADKQCFSLSSLNISGKDIIALGVMPSPIIGDVLEKLLDEVIEGRLENNHDVLINRALDLIR